MGRILSVLDTPSFKVLPCSPLNLDMERFSEYRDSDAHPAEEPFERPSFPNKVYTRAIPNIGADYPTFLHYFLDGSRRTYKVADVIVEGRYLPIVAGQIGVAVMKRRLDKRGVEPFREFCSFENVVAFPKGKVSEEDVAYWEPRISRAAGKPFSLLLYEVKPEREPVDLGIARIMKRMQDLEIETVLQMAERHLLARDKVLVIDGPLRFQKSFDLVQFRNVLGLSKTFRPSYTVGKSRTKQDVGSIASNLKFGERTSTFKTTDRDKTIGMWYLRIRDRKMMHDPLQGVVKVECYAIDDEDRESGFDGEWIDNFSWLIFRERNVTPYGADTRWASHIYPIYQAETYLKSSFMSDIRFEALF